MKLNIDKQKIEVKIRQGIVDDQILKVTGKGYPGSNGGQKGDLILRVKIKKHKRVERDGNDLYIELPVDLYKAILGGETIVSTFGGKLNLKIPKECRQGKTVKLRGQGMQNYNTSAKKGDLYVTFNVQLPKNLTDKEIELFTELQKLRQSK